jgi:hypothetical protein
MLKRHEIVFPRDLVARSPAGGAKRRPSCLPLNQQVLENLHESPRNTKKDKALTVAKYLCHHSKIGLNPARPSTFY